MAQWIKVKYAGSKCKACKKPFQLGEKVKWYGSGMRKLFVDTKNFGMTPLDSSSGLHQDNLTKNNRILCYFRN